ncbi:sensor histidine kinase [Planomonospora sp. ID82291]|uniref:sensor histidine kinase n=1 Tax=Planomonospora sp. ID82291 TaxID=2738136 RepID=UPI001A2574B5|nr:sensor histidine kinase [Planomonospora sp. ID82291]MBG0816216.1 sensor histidine kinase [Planomonospora sp. ID82291]
MRGLDRLSAVVGPGRARAAAATIAAVAVAMELADIWVTSRLPQSPSTPLPFAPEDVAGTAFPVFGALLVFQRPRLLVGWVLAVGGLACAANILAANVALLHAPSPSAPGAPAFLWVVVGQSWALASFLLGVLLPLVHPTGRLPSRRWRPLVLAGGAATASEGLLSTAVLLGAAPPQPVLRDVLHGLSAACMALAVASLAGRLRGADPLDRRRILCPLVATTTVVVPWMVGDPVWWLASFTIPLVPAAIAFAVLRHRLYGIDTLITRTLVGAGLVGVIGGVYMAVGTASSLLLSDVDRIGGLLAALFAGVFFHPLRKVLQRGADRLLYGSRGDPVALAAEARRRLQRTGPAEGLRAALEVLRDGLSVTGVAVRFSPRPADRGADRPPGETAGPAEEVVGELGEVARRVRLAWHGEPVGDLLIGRPGARRLPAAHNERVVSALTPYIADAAHAVLLVDTLRRSRERIITTREEERRRLRRDLHDGLGQSLSGMAMSINAARLSLRTSPESAERLLDGLRSGMDSVTSDIRHLVYGLRPPALDDLGLVGAIREMAGPQVAVEVRGDLTGLSAAVEVAAYRIVQEALTNAHRHARARTVRVALERNGRLGVRVSDDGVGVPAGRRSGVGLASMRERAAELGGTCMITSPPGGGTVVEAVLPAAEDAAVETGPVG